MKPKSISQIKNEVYKENFYFPDGGWHTLTELGKNRYWPEVCKRYAIECCKEIKSPLSELLAVIEKLKKPL